MLGKGFVEVSIPNHYELQESCSSDTYLAGILLEYDQKLQQHLPNNIKWLAKNIQSRSFICPSSEGLKPAELLPKHVQPHPLEVINKYTYVQI